MPRTLIALFQAFGRRRSNDKLEARYDALRQMPEMRRHRLHVSPFTEIQRAA